MPIVHGSQPVVNGRHLRSCILRYLAALGLDSLPFRVVTRFHQGDVACEVVVEYPVLVEERGGLEVPANLQGDLLAVVDAFIRRPDQCSAVRDPNGCAWSPEQVTVAPLLWYHDSSL